MGSFVRIANMYERLRRDGSRVKITGSLDESRKVTSNAGSLVLSKNQPAF